MADSPEAIEETRALAYEVLQRHPPGSKAASIAREALGQLPKRQVGRDMNKELALGSNIGGREVHGELTGGDLGSELPPTSDEMAGLSNEPAKPGIGTRAASHALYAPTRREFLRGVDDMVTLGAGQQLARGIEGTIRAKMKAGGVPDNMQDEILGPSLPGTQREDASESPNARGAGQFAGSLSPRGAAASIGRGALRAAKPITGAGTGFIGKATSGTIGGAAANMAAMPAIAGGQAAVRGENPIPAASGQLTPLNLAAGAAVGFLGGASRGIRERGQTGRDIQIVEKYAATPTPFGGAKGGAFDSPLLQDIEGTARDQGNLARRGGDYVYAGMEGEQRALSQQYASDKAAAQAAGQLEGLVPPDRLLAETDRLLKSTELTMAEKSAIRREVVNVLNDHPQGMTVDQFNGLRSKLGRIFGIGVSEADVPAIDSMRQAAKQTIDETEMGPINERYHAGQERLRRQRTQLGISENSRQDIAEKQIANLIVRRAGERNVTPGIQEGGDHGVTSFLQENPRYQLSFDLPEVVAAKERMSAGLDPKAGFFRRLGRHSLMEKNLEPAAVGLYRLGKTLEARGIPLSVAAQMLMGGQGPGFGELVGGDENAVP